MARETEQLVVALEARIREFEKNFQKAGRTANDNFSRMEKRAKQSGDRMEKSLSGAASRLGGVLKNFGAGFAGGILGGLSVAGLQRIASAVGDVAKNVAMIGSNAKMAGLSNRAFQELSYVAEQSRISVDALADGMKELALRADEWITTGGGSASEAFQRLGYSAGELKTKLKDPSALLVDIIARLQQLDKAAQIRIADELFGGQAGERFVELLDRGASGIRAMIAEAHSFGLVLDDDVIAKADEIDRKFNLISRTIGTRVKGAIVAAAGELLEFMDKMKDVEERQSATLGNQLTDLGARRLANENAILKLRNDRDSTIGGTLFGPAYDKQIEHLEREQQEIAEAEARILKILADRDAKETEAQKAAADAVPDITRLNTAVANGKTATDNAAKSLQSYGDAIRALKGEIPELAEQVAELNMRADIDRAYRAALQNARTMGQVNQANALRDQALAAVPGRMQELRDKGVDDASKEARQKAEDQIKAYGDIIASAQEFIASQQQEATAMGMAADAAAAYRYEQEMLNQAKREGIDLTADQRNEIATYAQGMAHAEKVTRQLADTQEQAAEISRMLGEHAIDALMGIADGSMTAMDALRNLLSMLIRMLLQAAFLGEGPLAGSLKGTGGLFGSLGKSLSSSLSGSTSPAAVSAGTGTPAVAKIAEQTFAAPLGNVERAPLPPVQDTVQQTVEGLRGTLSDTMKQAVQPVAEAIKTPATPVAPTGDAFKFLLGRTDKPASHIKGLNDDFQSRLAAFMQDPNAPKGLGIYSGFRSVDRQRELWNAALKKYGSPEKARKWVAPPGKSNHGFGQAADLSYNGRSLKHAPQDVVDWAHGNAGKYGLKFPLGNENWHVEMQETRGGKPFGGQFPPRPQETIPPGLDTMSTGSIDAARQAQEQAAAVQQQIEAQKRLAEQMAATQQATQAMQMPIQGIGQAATQVVPNLGGMGQGLTGLIGPLTSAIPGLGQFGGAIQSLIQQLMAMPMGGAGGIFGSLLGFRDGGEISGPGTGTSDSIPILASDGEYMVNAKSAKKHRRLLDAINSGHVPALAAGGAIRGGTFAPSNTYAPSLAINVAGSGNARQDAALAGLIADHVDRTLSKHRPDTFRRSQAQALTKQAADMQGAAGRNG